MSKNPFFKIYENVLSNDFCQHVIDKFENDSRKETGKIGRYQKGDVIDIKVKSTTEIVLSDEKIDWKPEFDIFIDSLKKCLSDYVKPYQQGLNTAISPELFKVVRYDIGGKFTMHSDNLGGNLSRIITAIWYLNDVNEGGETHYPWQNEKIKPKSGRLFLCPVGWPFIHEGLAPISNSKYIMITQLHQDYKNHRNQFQIR